MHVTVKKREPQPPQQMYVTTDVRMSKRLQERTLDLAGTSGAELSALRDFAHYTIANINSGDLEIGGNAERVRKWRDLKERVEASLKVPS